MDSTARLLAVVSLLKNTHGPVSLARLQRALASEGGYDGALPAVRRKFERDKKLLRDAGYELEWHAQQDGYTLVGGATSLALSPEETVLLLTAADLAGAGPLRSDVRAAVERVLAVANSMDEEAEAFSAWHPSREVVALDQTVERLLLACRRRMVVSMTYTDERGVATSRRVEPWGLCSRRGVWFLIGGCLLRGGAKRTFRVAFITDLHVEGLPDGPAVFVVPSGFDIRVEADLPPWDWSRHPPVELHLRVGVGLARNVALRLGGDAKVDGDEVRRTVTNASGVDGIVTELFPRVEVLGPPEAVATWDAHRQRLRAALGSAP